MVAPGVTTDHTKAVPRGAWEGSMESGVVIRGPRDYVRIACRERVYLSQ